MKGVLKILLVLTLLPSLALAAPPFAPPAEQRSRGAGEQRSGGVGEHRVCSPAPPHPCTLAPWGERGAEALQDATVRVDPAQSVVGAGQTLNVSVMIDAASDLGGFEFTLLFVSTTVTVDNVTLGDFPGSTGRMTIPIGPIIDNQAGTVSFAVATVGSESGPSGSGALATVTLTAQDSGQSPLDLQDVVVLDTNAGRKTTTVEDGIVRVGFAVYLPLILKDW